MSRTVIVITCNVYTGKASIHLLGSPTGTFITNEGADRICRVRSKGSRGGDAVDAQFFTQVVFCTLT
jgi:hypothetical protein